MNWTLIAQLGLAIAVLVLQSQVTALRKRVDRAEDELFNAYGHIDDASHELFGVCVLEMDHDNCLYDES